MEPGDALVRSTEAEGMAHEHHNWSELSRLCLWMRLDSLFEFTAEDPCRDQNRRNRPLMKGTQRP